MDGIRALSPDRDRINVAIDDVPVPSPKKNFNDLLEECLKNTNDVANNQTQRTNRKFPFLKKGQGLARYKPNPENTRTRPRARSLNLATNSKSSPLSQKSIQKPKEVQKLPRRSDPTRKSNTPSPNTILSKSIVSNNNNSRNKNLVNKNRIGVSKPQLQKSKEQPNPPIDLSSSDPETKTIKELEEIRIFELMEEKAENSSFCSNSSAVVAFLQQSSPLRNQLFMQRLSSQSRTTKDQSQTENQQMQEIICARSDFLTYRNNSQIKQQLPVTVGSNEENSTKWENFAIRRQQNSCDVVNILNSEEKIVCSVPYGMDVTDDEASKENGNESDELEESNASLHVRFAEFNEYKTIGLSDVSSISTSSQQSRAWSDCSPTPDSSDTDDRPEILFPSSEFNGTALRKNLVKEFCKRNIDMVEHDVDSCDDESSSTKATEGDGEDEIDDEVCSSKSSHDDTLLENNENKSNEISIIKDEADKEILFKSELLKSRLIELEREIEVFRNETNALKIQRQKLEEERKEFQKFIRERDELARAEKARVDNYLMEEKKRLAREKAALDSRLKDAREKAQKSKQERDEIASLRQQLDELREELYQKESKWQAAQARHKSQVRVLITQNKELKEEVERLEKLKLERQKSRKPNAIAKANTRAIHQINRMLQAGNKLRNKSCSSGDESLDNCEQSPESQIKQASTLSSRLPEPNQISSINIERQRNLYKSLLKDASIGIAEHEAAKQIAEQQFRNEIKESVEKDLHREGKRNEEKLAEARFALNLSQNADTSLKIQKSILKNVREVKEVDGHIEHWFRNGNVMKIFPDKNLKKLIYYNGDVRESDASGKIKYYYASSRTWQTTMPDGEEILEYHDGKVEKRLKDGTTEIQYPDGSIRIWEANGLEKWTLPDGTIGETLSDGSKIFKFANGQREVHTKDHKRREYPDGTVKIVYMDGTNETRYNNGRVRLKDKDGNLIMDSHQ